MQRHVLSALVLGAFGIVSARKPNRCHLQPDRYGQTAPAPPRRSMPSSRPQPAQPAREPAVRYAAAQPSAISAAASSSSCSAAAAHGRRRGRRPS